MKNWLSYTHPTLLFYPPFTNKCSGYLVADTSISNNLLEKSHKKSPLIGSVNLTWISNIIPRKAVEGELEREENET
ncbi:hypothetical protein EEL30_22660 [Brevibacillus laterosporus]|uniref:Uncharacterized protein n=1 Tax=Brevibacillus laterosporus TaxID=1465 RepID=A0A518VCW8_BRELA|nr:hypothetical protein EEL30_22660 [Brevibacillus laterosporus]